MLAIWAITHIGQNIGSNDLDANINFIPTSYRVSGPMKFEKRHGVLLYGYFGAGNLGDDLLLSVTVAELRATMTGARFFVCDHGDGAGLTALGPDVALTGIETVLADRTTSRAVRLWAYLKAYSQLFRQCRWLIFAGGTVFHERNSLTSLLLQLTICTLARFNGVRIAALGVGVADLQSVAGRWLLRRIINTTELFLVRDHAALQQCAGTAARLTDDLVFAWSSLNAIPPSRSGSLTIGLTVYPPACGGPGGAKIRAALAKAVRRWQANDHTVTFLVCQREGVIMGDDTIFAQLTAELGPRARPTDTRRLSTDAEKISKQLADIDVICGMRFHALVLAAMLGRPFAGIAHDNKISEICRRFQMPCFFVNDFNGVQLADSVESIKDRNPDPVLLQRNHYSAQENFRAFAALAT